MDLLTECPNANGTPSAGVAGALPARGAGGFMIDDRSCEETAPERRCACPRRPGGNPG